MFNFSHIAATNFGPLRLLRDRASRVLAFLLHQHRFALRSSRRLTGANRIMIGPGTRQLTGGEGLYLPNCQTNLVIDLYVLSKFFVIR